MHLKKEDIEVFNHNDGCNYSEVIFDYNGFHISIEIINESYGPNPLSVFVKNEKIDEAITANFSIINKELKIQISDIDYGKETKNRSLKEWLDLEKLQESLKFISKFLKK
jgi:hypothetical protein